MEDKFNWSDDLVTGISNLDDDHRKIFLLADELLDTSGGDEVAVSAALGVLWNYTKEHFAREEESMSQSKFPGLAWQVQQHEDLFVELEYLTERLEREGSDAVYASVARFVQEWLRDHILKGDMAYACFLKESLGQKSCERYSGVASY